MDENKLLRDVAKCPDNFGKKRENVRLLDREKIDDYKKLIRVLQDDNYRLEEERAKLKHQLKRVHILPNLDSITINIDELAQKFSLTKDQTNQLQESIIRITGG